METIPGTTTPQNYAVFWEYMGIEGQSIESGFSSHYEAAQYIADHATASEAANGTTVKNVDIIEISDGMQSMIDAANGVLPFVLRDYNLRDNERFTKLTDRINTYVLSPIEPIEHQHAGVNFISLPDPADKTGRRMETFLRFDFFMCIVGVKPDQRQTTISSKILYKYDPTDKKYWRFTNS